MKKMINSFGTSVFTFHDIVINGDFSVEVKEWKIVCLHDCACVCMSVWVFSHSYWVIVLLLFLFQYFDCMELYNTYISHTHTHVAVSLDRN